jgi:hypothetical protein
MPRPPAGRAIALGEQFQAQITLVGNFVLIDFGQRYHRIDLRAPEARLLGERLIALADTLEGKA